MTSTHASTPNTGAESSIWRDSMVMVERCSRHMLRTPDMVLTALVLPVMLMLLFVFVFGGAIETGAESYINYVVPGVLLLSLGYGAASTSVTVNLDATKGIIDRFRTMPIASSSVLVGHVVASVLRNSVAALLVLGVAMLLGYRASANAGDWALVILILLVYMLAMTWLAVAFGLWVGSPETASVFGFVVLFLPYLSSAFVPTASMPPLLQAFAEWQPFTPAIEAIRAALAGAPNAQTTILALAWWLVILLAGIVAANRTFVRRG